MRNGIASVPKECLEARRLLQNVLPPGELSASVKGVNQLTALAQILGASAVVTRPLNISGILVPRPAGYNIVLNEFDSTQRQKYSLAHEIGHLTILAQPNRTLEQAEKHRDPITASHHGNKAEERLCEAIAAELLMPADAFKRQVSEIGQSLQNVSKLAYIFGTSITATAIRYSELLDGPCLLVRWRSDSKNQGSLRPEWQLRNKIGGPSVKLVPKGRAPFLGADAAYKAEGIKTTNEVILTKARSGSRSHLEFPRYGTESIGFGKDKNRFVLSVAYLDRNLE